jgi:kynureninase
MPDSPLNAEHSELLAYREEFPILQRKIYLNSCSLGALSQRSLAALHEFTEDWNNWGAHAWYELWLGKIAEVKEKLAQIINAKPAEIALAPNVSSALAAIGTALDYSQRRRVVVSEMDFPTLTYQWLAKERLGVEVVFATSADRISVAPERVIEAIDDHTALVAISRVFYTSGYIQDLPPIIAAAHRHGALVLVDDYQGTGQIPIDVHALGVDILVTGTLKWLMGGPGLAFLYVREDLVPQLQPTVTGWFGHREQFAFDNRRFTYRDDAARLETGTPALPTVFLASGGLDIVREIGVARIRERTQFLTADLIARAQEHGWAVRSPTDPERRASIVMLQLDHPEAIVERLIERDIIVDHRPGLVRVSPYFYNTVEEQAQLVDEVAKIVRKG